MLCGFFFSLSPLNPAHYNLNSQSKFFPYPYGFSLPLHLALQMESYGEIVSLYLGVTLVCSGNT